MRVHTTATVTLRATDGTAARACLRVVGAYSPGTPDVGPGYSHGGIPGDPPETEVLEAVLESWEPEGDSGWEGVWDGMVGRDVRWLLEEPENEASSIAVHDAICEAGEDRTWG